MILKKKFIKKNSIGIGCISLLKNLAFIVKM